MVRLTLSEAAKWMNAKLLGADQIFEGVSTDTRSLTEGNLFIAIKGERVDGHDYLEDARLKGAKAALVNHPVKSNLPLLQVSDTVLALGVLARQYRQQFSIPLVAITGSCGKTTVKEMLASILSVQGSVLASQGNFNTEIGVPLSLLQLSPEHRYGVIEMGARQKGDIQYLMELVSPDVSVITNAGSAHVEIFGSERGIAEAKGEIYRYLKPKGIAVINTDQEYSSYWKQLLKTQSLLTFGLNHQGSNAEPQITCRHLTLTDSGSTFELMNPQGSITIQLNVPGQHNIINALAAASLAVALKIPLSDIAIGLKRFVSVSGRLQIKRDLQGVRILDDTYNANPASVRAALSVLAAYPGEKIFVMGDMLELGEQALHLHQMMGEEALRLGIQKLFGFGKLTLNTVQAFGAQAKHYLDKATLISELKPCLCPNTTILIKGSRGMRMEEVVQALLESNRENHPC